MNNFSQKFLSNNSIKYFTWWTENRKIALGKRSPKVNEFDLLAEVVKKANNLTNVVD